MLLHLVRRELLDHLLSLRFAIASILCLVVLLLSSGVASRDFSEAASEYNVNVARHHGEIVARTKIQDLWKDIALDRPANVMNVLVRGITPELTETVRFTRGHSIDFPERSEQNPVVLLFPRLDLVFIVGVIMSLLAFAFSYDCVAGERESGLLKLVMSYSVPRDKLILAKWIGGYVALIAPFVLAVLAALLIATLSPRVVPSLETSLSVFAILVAALLFIGALFSVGIFVSSMSQSPTTAITTLLLLWVGFVLAVPNTAPYLVRHLIDVPSRVSVNREKQEIQREGQQAMQELAKEEKERTGIANFWGDEQFQEKSRSMWQTYEEQTARVEEDYRVRFEDRARWSGVFARLSPVTAFNLAAFDLAAAGVAQESRFVEALESHGSTWQKFIAEKRTEYDAFMLEQSKSGTMRFTAEDMARFDNIDMTDYPRFDFKFMSFKERLNLVYPDLLLLVLWNVVFFMLGYFAFLRSRIH